MLRNKRLIAIAAIFVCFLLAACGRETVEPEPSAATPAASVQERESREHLSFRITWKGYSGRGETIQRIVDAYNGRQNDGAQITMLNGDEDQAAIEVLLKSERETVYVLPYRYVQYFADKGLLLDLTDTFIDEKDLFYPEVWLLGSVKGATYGVPWLGHSMCLLYNKNILEKAGVQAESINSMNRFIEAIAAIREKTGAGGLGLVGAESNDVSWMVNQFIYGYGSSLVSEDGRTVTINNEKSVEALHLYRDTLGPYAQPAWADDTAAEVLNAFREQKIAFEILGIWGVTDIEKNGEPFEVGILPLKSIGLCSEVGPMMLSVPAGISVEGKEAAVEFIRYLISKEAQEEILKGEYSPEHDAYYPFRTPIRVDMEDSPLIQDHPEYLLFIEGFKTPSVDVPVPAWQSVKETLYEPGLHQVMSGQTSIEEFLATVEREGNRILQEQ